MKQSKNDCELYLFFAIIEFKVTVQNEVWLQHKPMKFIFEDGSGENGVENRRQADMKVLIADDEPKVCKLIQHLVDWDEFGMEIVGVVNDGKTALDLVCSKQPDIVITDIRMPNYDGLELIRRSKELFPAISFIVISGYSQFEYAQKAIKYGVKDYLLKPLKKRELENTLHGIKEQYESSMADEKEREKIRVLADASRKQAKENLLVLLLTNKNAILALKDTNLEEINQQHGTAFVDGFFNVVRLHPFFGGSGISDEIISFFQKKLNQLAKERLSCCCQEVICTVYEEEVVCMINFITEDCAEIERQLKHIRIDMSNLSDMIEEVQLIAGIGRSAEDISQIGRCIEESDEALLNRMGENSSYCMWYQEQEQSLEVSDLIDIQKRSDILACQERLDVEGVEKQILSIEKRLKPYRKDGKFIYSCYCELIQILQFGMKSFGVAVFPDYILQFKKRKTYEEVFEWITAVIKSEYELYIENKKDAVSRPIRDAKQYIYDHFSMNITLECVSEQIGFNPAYFSTLFKKETGKNFLEYVTELRMQKAKNYLMQTDYDIAEIASSVGYGDLKYFSKLFKKNTGLSPSEFRKLYY